MTGQRETTKQRREQGQEIVLFGVMLAVVVVAGGVLALNLVWLRGQWTALQEAALSAAAAATLETRAVPGVRGLDAGAAQDITVQVLADNLAALPFLDDEPGTIAQTAQVEVHDDPPPGAPSVALSVQVPVRLPWLGWRLSLPIRVIAEAGESPE